MKDIEIVNKLLDWSEHMVIAVTLADNTPWTVPVHIKHRENHIVFEWDSNEAAEHSKAIASNPNIALTIFSIEKDLGFYAKAIAERIPGEPNAHNQVRYRATVKQCWLNEAHKKREVTS